MADTSWLNRRLSHPDYNNWVKGNLILRELKTALVPFLDEKAKDLQQHVLRHVPSAVCTVCTGDDLRKKRYICPSAGICTTILQDINTVFTHHPCGTVKLVNTNNQAWCDTARYWEIAKAYISTPGYASKTSAAETDSFGLLTIIINCTWIQSFLSVSPGVFHQVKDLRNAIMHSEKNTLAADQLENLYDKCIQILKDRRCFAVDSTAQAALARITEIKSKTLSVSDINVPHLLFIVEELKAEQDQHREAIGHLETQSTALEIISSNLKVWQKLLETKLEEQKKAISQLDATVSQLGSQVSIHHVEPLKAGTTVSQLQRVSYHHDEHQHAVSQLGKRVSHWYPYDEHQQAVSQLGTTVSQLDITVSQLDKRVSDHHDEQQQAMSQLRKRLKYHHSEHQQALSQLCARASSLATKHPTDNIQMPKELDELKYYLINAKYKQDILQGEPNVWFEMKDVLQMCAPFEIREDLERCMALSSMERKKARPSQASAFRKIESMHDIFFKGSERQYKIILLGEAGVGKSTFCHQLVDNWCRVQDSETKIDYESVMKSFAFLFFIQARYSDKSQTVYTMIKEQLCPLKYHTVLKKLLTSHPESCLVLIDGLDEWQSGIRGYQELPNVTDLEGCTILITSRRWRVEALDCDLGPSCRVLEIRGLDSGGIENLVVKVFEVFTREDNPGADCKPLVNQFMKKLSLLKLNNFAQIPLLLIILIKSWLNGNRNLENARGFIYSGLIETLLVHSGKTVENTGTWGHRANTPALPNCFYKRQHCLEHSSLIHELSRLAFEMLFSGEKENSLVFRKKELAQQLDVKEHLTLCLQLGLLTETKDFSQTNECQRSFSFPHTSIQQYFSAVYLCGKGFETGFARFCERVTSPVEVFHFENVVLFLSGMNLTHCKKLFDYICSIVFCRKFADEELYPVDWYMGDTLEKIEKLAVRCTAEARHSVLEGSHTGESQFVIPDMVVRRGTPEHKVEQFCSLGLNIKSLVYDCTVPPFSVVQAIRTMQYIQRLGIDCTADNTEKYIVCICRNLSNLHQLNSFRFRVVDGTVRLPIHVLTELVSKLCTLPNLVSVYLQSLDLSDINTCPFTSQLSSLGLKDTKSLSLGVMLGWCNQLHTLDMDDVYLSPAAVHQLCQYLMTSSSLQSLGLLLPNTVFDDVLDLTSHTLLHTLRLNSIELKYGVRIHTGRNWRKIEMDIVSMSEPMWQEFIHNLPTEPLQQLDVMLFNVKSLNTQTMSYIRYKFCVTEDTTNIYWRIIFFNTKH